MSGENIFDLSKIATVSHDIETRKKTIPDQNKLLIGYEKYPEEDWKNIPVGSYIRYLRKDGEFRKGGVVQAVWTAADKLGNDITKIEISGTYGIKNSTWSVTSNTVEKIWVKEVKRATTSVTDLQDLKDDIKYCKESIDQLSKEIHRINNEQKRTIALLQKLANRK